MPNSGEKFTPLPEINFVAENLHFNLASLPAWVNQARIGVNSRALRRLLFVSGMRSVNVVGRSDMKTSRIEGKVSSFGSGMNDTLTAAKTSFATQTEPTFLNDLENAERLSVYHATRWKHLTVSLNTKEMIQRMNDQKQSTRSHEAWANQLDQALRGSIRTAGTKNLLTLDQNDIFYNLISNSTDLVRIAQFFLEQEHTKTVAHFLLERLAVLTIGEYVLLTFILSMQYLFTRQLPPVRPTLLPLGPEFDGAIALQFLAGQTLIKSLDHLPPEQILHVNEAKAQRFIGHLPENADDENDEQSPEIEP